MKQFFMLIITIILITVFCQGCLLGKIDSKPETPEPPDLLDCTSATSEYPHIYQCVLKEYPELRCLVHTNGGMYCYQVLKKQGEPK